MRNNGSDLKCLLLAFVFIVLLLITTQIVKAEEVITKQIGEDEYEFVIPDDYDTLKEYYITIVDTYVEAENKNIEYKSTIENFIALSDGLNSNVSALEDSVNNLNKDIKDYMKAVDKGKWYVGPLVGYHFLVDDGKATSFITIGGALSWVKPTYMISLEIPFSVYVEQQAFSAGINIPFQFRLSK